MSATRKDIRRYFRLWIKALKLKEYKILLEFPNPAVEEDALAMTMPNHGGDEPESFVIIINPSCMQEPRHTVWKIVCHELIHTMSWNYRGIIDTVVPYLPQKALHVANLAEVKAAESLAYRLADVLCELYPCPDED